MSRIKEFGAFFVVSAAALNACGGDSENKGIDLCTQALPESQRQLDTDRSMQEETGNLVFEGGFFSFSHLEGGGPQFILRCMFEAALLDNSDSATIKNDKYSIHIRSNVNSEINSENLKSSFNIQVHGRFEDFDNFLDEKRKVIAEMERLFGVDNLCIGNFFTGWVTDRPLSDLVGFNEKEVQILTDCLPQ